MERPWESDDQEECWSDREAWRGDQHVETFTPSMWRQKSEVGWVWPEPEPLIDESDKPE